MLINIYTMEWWNEFNAGFFLGTGGIIGVILAYCFKSKCSEFSICGTAGLIHIVRDVQAENEETKMELEHNIKKIDGLDIV